MAKEEERKGEPTLTEQVTKECEKFESAKSVVKVSIEAEKKCYYEQKQT